MQPKDTHLNNILDERQRQNAACALIKSEQEKQQ